MPKYLTDIHPFMIGRHVVRKNPPLLVGTIDDVICDIEVKFNDGGVCMLEKVWNIISDLLLLLTLFRLPQKE